MSELAIITSDIHIHTYKNFNENDRRLKNGVDYLDYLFKLADKNKIKYIFLPGDLTNNMQIIATKVVNAIAICLKRNFEDFPGIKIIAISGNHDQVAKNLLEQPSESALTHLQAIFPENFILLDDMDEDLIFITEHNHIVRGIPYFEHSEHFLKAITNMPSTISTLYNNFLLMHQTVASGLPIEDDIEATDPLFDKFTMVFNGHIHVNQQITDKFINVGSPLHRDAGDIGKAKGFWIVDLDDPINTISFKDVTTKYPQFIHKTVGEIPTDWEAQQYIIWIPAELPEETSDKERSEKFQTKLSPASLLENYCKEVLSEKDLKDKLAYGLKLLS